LRRTQKEQPLSTPYSAQGDTTQKVTPMTASRRVRRLAPIALLAGAASLAACSAAGSHPAALVKRSAAPASASHVAQYLHHSSPAEATPGPTSTQAQAPAPVQQPAPTGQPAAPEPAACPDGHLRVTLGAAEGAAGSIYYALMFTNGSRASCTMYGYPGVAFVTAPGGTQLGGGATQNPAFARQLVTLAPGATAHASLQVAVAQNYPTQTCKPVTAHWLQVYPPGTLAPLYVRLTAATCTGRVPGGTTLGISVVMPGATGP
jgi:hypothetical protein